MPGSLLYENNYINNKNDNLTNNNLNKNKNLIELNDKNEDGSLIQSQIENLDNKKIYRKKKKFKITRINIDSRNRIVTPKNILDGSVKYLPNNPLSFNENSNIMEIFTNESHNLKIYDTIIIQNVKSNIVYLKGGIEIKKNNYYIKINHINHLISENTSDNYVEISGAKGTINNESSYDNISLSLINKIHKIYLLSDDDNIGSENYFYIKLDSFPNSDITDNNSNIKLIYKNIAGININEINANFPININQINGYLTVSSVISDNIFTVELKKKASMTLKNVGSDNIYYCKIKGNISAYPKPNSYKIDLGITLENVSKIKMISSEFPNTERVIKGFSDLKNNLLYFQVLEDGDNLYKIEVTQGNYNLTGLQNEIRYKIEQLDRVSYIDNRSLDDGVNSLIQKSNKFSANVVINPYTDVFTLSLFSVQTAIKCVSVSSDIYEDQQKRIFINHLNHSLSAGDEITLQNCISTLLIPSTILNTSHIIDYVIDINNYAIKLPLHNESSNVTTNTGGGSAIRILIPLKIRLLFNYPYTIGKIIGFRNIGEVNSITVFNTKISNNMPYDYDYYKDKVGSDLYYDKGQNIIQNNSIQLSGDNYILMTCDALKNSNAISSNNITNLFVKILLSDSPGSILFNQHIQLTDELLKPIKTLSEIEFKFYSQSGNLYEFEGIDHSFTLEFYEESSDIYFANKHSWEPKEEVVIS